MKKRFIKVLFCVLLLSAILDTAVAETQNVIWMDKPSNYKLHVKNDSQQSGGVCVFQTFPEQENNKNIYSLVWFSKALHPGTAVSFEWDLKYSFVWRESGELTPEIKFFASESKYADPMDVNKNLQVLSKKNGAFAFNNNYALWGTQGLLTIKADHTIPNDIVSVGIGVGGKAVIAVNAFANMPYQFTPKPTYWIVFGDFVEGSVIDANRIGGAMEVVFDYNVYEKSFVFTESNVWEVLN